MKKKNIFIYSICISLILVYLCVLSLVLKDEYTYSYRMYYIESKTDYWYGYDGLIVDFGKSYDYSKTFDIELEGLQYLGEDFEDVYSLETEDSDYELKEIKLTKSSTLYFELEEPEKIEKYKVILGIEDYQNLDLEFYINETKIETVNYKDKVILEIENIASENRLNIKSSDEAKFISLCFEVA